MNMKEELAAALESDCACVHNRSMCGRYGAGVRGGRKA